MKKLIMVLQVALILSSLQIYQIYADVPIETTASWYPKQSYTEVAAAVGDINLDGYLDLVIYGDYIRLYKNYNGVLETTPSWTHTTSFGGEITGYGDRLALGDINSDGFLELAIAIPRSTAAYPPRVLNNNNGNLSDTGYWQPTDNLGTNSVVAFADIVAPWASLDLFVGGGNKSYKRYSRVYKYTNGALQTVACWTGCYGKTVTAVLANIGGVNKSPELIAGDYDGFVRVYSHNWTTLEKTTSCSLYMGVGNNVHSVAIGDWDNDDKMDLAVGGSFGVRVYTNQQSNPPKFSTNVAWSVNPGTVNSVAWGDINRDNFLDLAVGMDSGSSLLYTNSGNGLDSTPAWTASESGRCFKIMCADMDNDRDLEIIAGANYNYLPYLYKNNSICFDSVPSWQSAENNHFYEINFDDIDNDGRLDLVGGNNSSYPNRVYRNIGTNLQTTAYWQATKNTNTLGIALIDLKNSGKLDLVAGKGGPGTNTGRVIFYSNTGTTFISTNRWASRSNKLFTDIEAIDIDGDGYDEIFASIYNDQSYIFKNNAGILETTNTWVRSSARASICKVADIDNDKDLDLIMAVGWDSTARVFRTINKQLESSPFWSSKESIDGPSTRRGLALADVDLDGYIDIVQGGWSPLYLYKNQNGVPEYSASWSSQLSEAYTGCEFGDINGDGYFDLVSSSENRFMLYMNNKGVLENYPSYIVNEGNQSIGLADIDDDGDLDLAVGGESSTAKIYKNNYFVEIKNLPNDPPMVSKVTTQNLGGNEIKFIYYITDNDRDRCWMSVEYSLKGQSKWYNATVINTSPDALNNLRTSPTGVRQEFTWDAAADNVTTPYAIIRMTVFPYFGKSYGYGQSGGPIMYSGYTYQKYVRIKIDGRPYAQIVSPQSGQNLKQGDNIVVTGAAYDQNFQRYYLEVKTNSGAGSWFTITNCTTEVTPYGYLGTWKATNRTGSYILRLRAIDNASPNQVWTNSIVVNLTMPPGGVPTVVKTFPSANATEVALNSPVIARFSEYMNETTLDSGTIKVYDGSQFIDGSIDYNYFTRTLAFIPSQNLTPNTYYIVTISSNFQNIYGVPLTVNYSWGFRTDSEFSSIITQVSPPAGKTDVEKNLNAVIVKYNKEVASGWQNYLYVSNFITGSAMSGIKYYHTNYIELQPSYVASNALYICTVGAQATGVPAPYTWYFITKDTLTPQVTSISPNDNGEISLSGIVEVTFNKRMNDVSFMTDTFYVVCSNNNQKLSGTREYNIAQNLAKFIPATSSLTQGRTYIATLTTGVKDYGGIPLSKTTNWKFRTPPPLQNPTVLMPANNSTNNVLKDILISAQFSSGLESDTVNPSTFYVKPASGAQLSGSFDKSTNFKIKFQPDGYLSQNTWYTAVITKSVKSTNGTYLTNTFKWKFRTLPSVNTNTITITPGKSVTNVTLSTQIKVTFNTNLESSTVHPGSFYAYYISGSTTNIVPAEVYVPTGEPKSALISPSGLLPQDQTIYVKITTNLKTVLGTYISPDYIWSFKTLSPLSNPTNLLPSANSTNIPLINLNVQATFMKKIQGGSLNSSSFIIKSQTGTNPGGLYSTISNLILFTPSESLSHNTWYTSIITTNLISMENTHLKTNFKWKFKTMPFVATNDLILSPGKNTTNISLTPTIKAGFKTNLEPGTVHSGSFFVYHISGSITNVVAADISVTSMTAQISPKVLLPQNKIIYVKITPAVKTKVGTSLSNSFIWSFKTLKPLPGTATTYPSNGATNVSLSTIVESAFATNLNSSTINDLTFYLLMGTNKIAGTRTYNDADKKITFTPSIPLNPNTVYTAYCTTNVKTVAGTSLASNKKWWFKTVPPLSNPTVTPVSATTNIALNCQVRAEFVTNINISTVNLSTFYIKPSGGDIISGSYDTTTNKIIKFIPSANLSQNTYYTAVITTGLKSSIGTSLVSNYKWFFKTIPPLSNPTNITPQANSSNIALTSQIKAIFRTNINSGTLNSSTFKIISEAGENIAGNYYTVGKSITFVPSDLLEHNTFYTSIISTGLKDINGASLTNEYRWFFRTMPHIPTSAILETSPPNNSTNAGVGIHPSIRFTNTYPIDGSTVNILNVKMTNLGNSSKIIYGNVSFDAGQNEITYVTSSTLDQGNWYRVTITTNVKTTYGTTLLSNYTWQFKTTAPYPCDIVSYSPTNSMTNVALNTIISVTFFTDIDSATVTPTSFYVTNSLGNYVSGTRATAGKTVTFTPTGGVFKQNMTYTVYIMDKQIKYTTGIYVVSGKIWSFKTAIPLGAPTNVSPANGTTNVALSGLEVRATFVTNVNQTTLTPSTFYVKTADGYTVNGSLSLVGNRVIKFTPSVLLSQNTIYTAVITSGLKSVLGTSLSNDYKWYFKTMPPIGAPSQVYPADGQKNINLVVTIYAKFNYDLDPTTCINDNFRLYKSDLAISGDISYDSAEKKIKFQPKLPLDPESVYRIVLSKNIKTIAGVSMTNDYEWTFETGKIIGKTGGNIQSDDGILTLIVPLHALTENQVLSITKLSSSQMTNIGANIKATGIGYEIGPVEYKLMKLITIKINLTAANLIGYDNGKLAIYYYDTDKWVRLGGSVDRNRNTLTVSYGKLGKFCLVEDNNSYKGEGEIEKIEILPRVFSPMKAGIAVISFELKSAGRYTVKIFDMSERPVKILCEGVEGSYGNNSVMWDGKDENNKIVSDGMYILSIELETGGKKVVKVKPFVLMNK